MSICCGPTLTMGLLDRDGNGTIDTGRELFGDATIKSNGQTATDGFDALADLDSNADGKIGSEDTRYAHLRVWRDLNQDGQSQSGELFTLNDLGIASIHVASTDHSQILANGNQLADTGTTGEVAGNLGRGRGDETPRRVAFNQYHRANRNSRAFDVYQ